MAEKTEISARPDSSIKDPAIMRGLLLNYSEMILSLEEERKVLAPKAEALDRIFRRRCEVHYR